MPSTTKGKGRRDQGGQVASCASYGNDEETVHGPIMTSWPLHEAKTLTAVYKLLAKKRKSLHLQQAYWFTWLTYDKAHDNHFDYAGVLHLGANGSIKPKPAYKALGKVALGLEGCKAKASFADSCAP